MEVTVEETTEIATKSMPFPMVEQAAEKDCGGCKDEASNYKPCGDSVSDDIPAEQDTSRPWVARQLETAFYNSLELLFEARGEQTSADPKRILMVGGCRQLDVARRLGFVLPFSTITLLDSDEAIARQAQEKIQCRFRFDDSPLTALPYPDDHFDMVLALNVYEQANDQTIGRVVRELARVCHGHLLVSAHRPITGALVSLWPKSNEAFEQLGMLLPTGEGLSKDGQVWPDDSLLKKALMDVAESVMTLQPWPWLMQLAALKPKREKRTQAV
ncbi:MAG: class I SAM-dependent methyltransferase [Vampirovibrionales bacterium]